MLRSIATTTNMLMPAMFTCERRQMRLTKVGCSRLWTSANGPKPPDPFEGRAACRNCPIGCKNATGETQDPIVELAAALVNVCSRCGRKADRLINRQTRGLCPSCDAREGEAIRGRNSKGNRPALANMLHTEQVAVTSAGVTSIIVRRDCLTTEELILHTRKFMKQPGVFTIDATLALHGAGGFEADGQRVHVLRAMSETEIERRRMQGERARMDAARVPGYAGGRPRADRENPYNGRIAAGYGNAKAYLLRRVARQSPDVLAAYEQGSYPSVRAAARACGIIRAA
jgi:hypothetical protein